MAQPSYYCTHISKHIPGATHDFELFKRGYYVYLEYLLKLPTESKQLPGNANNCYWALLCDLGYIGPEGASPDVHRVCPVKFAYSHQDHTYNISHAQFRVHIKRFFGHLLGLFSIFCEAATDGHMKVLMMTSLYAAP